MLFLREAIPSDKDLLFVWANDPLVRNNSFNESIIPYEVHCNWFDRMMADSTVHQYILMDGETPAGQVRLTEDGEQAEIGYSISADFRGKGYGSALIGLITELTRERFPNIARLTARVKPGNTASIKAFEHGRFSPAYYCFSRTLRD